MDVSALNAPCRSFPEMISLCRIRQSKTPSQLTAQMGARLFVKKGLDTTRPNMEAALTPVALDLYVY
jgi:hypothetical protein